MSWPWPSRASELESERARIASSPSIHSNPWSAASCTMSSEIACSGGHIPRGRTPKLRVWDSMPRRSCSAASSGCANARRGIARSGRAIGGQHFAQQLELRAEDRLLVRLGEVAAFPHQLADDGVALHDLGANP